MNLQIIVDTYPSEERCIKSFKEYRDFKTVICLNCGCIDHYWKQDRFQYECKNCHKRQTLKSNSILQDSKLPFRYWFIAIYLITVTKYNISALELQRLLNHSRYEPIWKMHRKLIILITKHSTNGFSDWELLQKTVLCTKYPSIEEYGYDTKSKFVVNTAYENHKFKFRLRLPQLYFMFIIPHELAIRPCKYKIFEDCDLTLFRNTKFIQLMRSFDWTGISNLL